MGYLKKLVAAMGMVAASAVAAQAGWTGCGVGLQGGLSTGQHDVSIGAFELSGLGSDGYVAGVNANCDWQLGDKIVIGVGADYNFGSTKLEVNPGLFSVEMGNSWDVYLRGGVLLTPATLLYILGGYSDTDVSWTIAGLAPPEAKGLMLGAGIEAKFSPNMTLGLEYRRHIAEQETILGAVNIDTTRDEIMGRIKYNIGLFGGGQDEPAPRSMK